MCSQNSCVLIEWFRSFFWQQKHAKSNALCYSACALISCAVTTTSIPVNLQRGVIDETIGDATSDGTSIFVTTYSDTTRIIKLSANDLSRAQNFDIPVASGITFTNTIHTRNNRAFVLGYKNSQLGAGQYGGSKQSTSKGFGAPVLARFNTVGDTSLFIKQISIPTSTNNDFYCSQEGPQPTTIFSDNNYVYVNARVDGNSTLLRYDINTLASAGSLFIPNKAFVGVTMNNPRVVYVGQNIVSFVTLNNFQKQASDKTLPTTNIINPTLFGRYLYFSRTTIVSTNPTAGTRKLQTQAIRYDIDNNFAQVIFNVGTAQDIGSYLPQSVDLRFLADRNTNAPNLFALRYSSVSSPSSGTSTSDLQLFKIVVATNAVTDTGLTLPGTSTNFCAVAGAPSPGTIFLISVVGVITYGVNSGTIRRVTGLSTPAKITHTITLSRDGTRNAATMDVRGDTIVYTTTTGQIGTYSLTTQTGRVSALPQSFEKFSGYYVDATGAFAYVPQPGTYPNGQIVKVNLSTLKVVYTHTLPPAYQPFASTVKNGVILFFLFRPQLFPYEDNPGNPANIAIYDIQRGVITQTLDVTSLEMYLINTATFSNDGKYVYISRGEYGQYSIIRYNTDTNSIDKTQAVTEEKQPLAFTVGGNYLYAASASYSSGPQITRYDINTLAPQGTISIPLGENPLQYVSKLLITKDNQFGYWGARGVLKKINMNTFTTVASQQVVRAGVAAIVQANDGKIYTAGTTNADSSQYGLIIRMPSNLGVV
jgi:hypothetical protein